VADPNEKALKKNTTEMDDKQANTNGEAIKGERSAYPNGEHIKMQKIIVNLISKALKKIAEMAEDPNADTEESNADTKGEAEGERGGNRQLQ
jgi:hypothetical protein